MFGRLAEYEDPNLRIGPGDAVCNFEPNFGDTTTTEIIDEFGFVFGFAPPESSPSRIW
jgi:hypothetical protein